MSAASPRIVILTADTGGGHRSVAEALTEAFHEIGQTNVDVVDVFQYVPWPFRDMPKWYMPTINRASLLWKLIYLFFGGRIRGGFYLRSLVYPLSRNGLRRLYGEHPPDLVVSTHPVFQYNAARVLHAQRRGVPFVTMVTDFASAHRWWFTPLTDLCLVPSDELRCVAKTCGVSARKIYVTGLPVHRSFALNREVSRQEARRALGLQECRTLLLVGGGEGMGALDLMAEAVDRTMPNLQKLIVAGRNSKLKARLDAHAWAAPTRVYGFVRNMPQLMR
ncbi:MAG: hypothetical protein LC737_09125, partial [Chloroflexi bacterium]|nr:hypothetical protein [Chloroflexota bacterium]